ncbi:MAG TPA: hypothetical protein VGY99_17150 [Candidatus Binataceae bacterium]|nr:hypothetical protein [Candidatus Binataceae bacterium]
MGTDAVGNLYVADTQNNRVLEYSSPKALSNTTADAVFGQDNSFGTNICNFDQTCNRAGCTLGPAGLCNPLAVAVNHAGNVFIADGDNGRITGYLSPLTTDKTADIIISQGGLSGGLGFDSSGNLYISATGVVEYNAPLFTGAHPNAVIPQAAGGFCGPFGAQPDALSLCSAAAVALDSADNLYVADWPYNRVLEFDKPIPTVTPTPTTTPTSTPRRTATPTTTPTRTPRRTATPTTTPTRTPKPTATPTPMPPVIKGIPCVILAGASFNIVGSNFTTGSKVNFFVATSRGSRNAGPMIPTARSLPTQLTVSVPAKTMLGEGFVSVEVVNTDKGFGVSNGASALLQGSAAAGIPSLTSINGTGLATTCSDPGYAINNVETVVHQGSAVTLGGSGFDTVHGVAVDLFCACAGGKVGPFLLDPGNPGLSSTSISFMLPMAGTKAPLTGPGSFVVSNAGASKAYSEKSNAVSVPIGQKISVTSVSQSGSTITVVGTGFSTLTVINFFNDQDGVAVSLGGFGAGVPKIALTFVNSDRFTFTRPARAVAGASYVQALNPPFLPFTSSGNAAAGAFTLK